MVIDQQILNLGYYGKFPVVQHLSQVGTSLVGGVLC